MPRIILDFDPPLTDPPAFAGDTSDLVYFLSWAYSARYGASHEMAVAALILRTEFKIDLQPLLTFADRDVEVPEDAETLERVWQDAAPLAGCCGRIAEALLVTKTQRLVELQAEYPRLRESIVELGQSAAFAAARGARMRVTYLMAEDA